MNQEMVEEFHRKNGHPIFESGTSLDLNTVGSPPAQLRLLRARLITEEAAEAVIAIHEQNLGDLADALADLLYVAYGTAVAYGIPLDEVFKEVHRSNMSKDPLNEHQKGGKGPGYSPPDVAGVLQGRARRPQEGSGRDRARGIQAK